MANRQIAEDTLMDDDEINLLDYWRVLVKRKLPAPPPDIRLHSKHILAPAGEGGRQASHSFLAVLAPLQIDKYNIIMENRIK